MSALPFIPLLPGSMRSMSVTCSVPFRVPVRTSNPVIKHADDIFMLKHNHDPGKKSSTFQMRSFSKNTVFEDQSEGVICYRDENGEIVCEGYDEGPRFPRQIPGKSYHLRDAEILDILRHRWLQIVNGDGFGNANKGVIIVKDDS
ncbi:uncharacterized protein LOC108473178 [Gossypium arboreum]|uniref:Uncharacterized protein n=2 Tax=Gossypium arboreum TaxID=29729 RepID=A0ABR0PPP8_GOSAR|nr:uncharacterized protein LOC108473178 [Gossypium arboreum]KAK5826155.1 hypothetical protein PVK06_021066 [Gossypium arboreum]